MTRWLRDKVVYCATWFGLRVMLLAFRILPRQWIFYFSDFLARVGYYLFRGYRKRSVANASAALGEPVDGREVTAIVQRALRNFFRACVEIGIALSASQEQLRREIALSGCERLDAALAKGRGVIVLSAHLGNFFLVGTRLAIEGYITHVLVNQPEDLRLAKLWDDCRSQAQLKTIHARPRREAFLKLNEVLRRNEVVVVIADEYRSGSGIQVPLFGKTVIARRGPVTLALRTGAAIVPACMVRQSDDSLELDIEPELELERSVRDQTRIRENTVRITEWLEHRVRAHPDQWNWLNFRWWSDINQDRNREHENVPRSV